MNIDPQKTAQVVNTLDDYINQDITAIANDNTFDFMKTWLTNKLVQLQGEKIVWLRKNQYFPASDSAFGDQWYAYAKSTEQEITSTWNIGGIPSVDMILGRGGGLTVSVDQAAIPWYILVGIAGVVIVVGVVAIKRH